MLRRLIGSINVYNVTISALLCIILYEGMEVAKLSNPVTKYRPIIMKDNYGLYHVLYNYTVTGCGCSKSISGKEFVKHMKSVHNKVVKFNDDNVEFADGM